jgi:hypothetical protein
LLEHIVVANNQRSDLFLNTVLDHLLGSFAHMITGLVVSLFLKGCRVLCSISSKRLRIFDTLQTGIPLVEPQV